MHEKKQKKILNKHVTQQDLNLCLLINSPSLYHCATQICYIHYKNLLTQSKFLEVSTFFLVSFCE